MATVALICIRTPSLEPYTVKIWDLIISDSECCLSQCWRDGWKPTVESLCRSSKIIWAGRAKYLFLRHNTQSGEESQHIWWKKNKSKYKNSLLLCTCKTWQYPDGKGFCIEVMFYVQKGYFGAQFGEFVPEVHLSRAFASCCRSLVLACEHDFVREGEILLCASLSVKG